MQVILDADDFEELWVEIRRLRQRVDELLKANTELVEARREAERERDQVMKGTPVIGRNIRELE